MGRGDGFPNTSRVFVEHGHYLVINFSTGSGSGNPSLWAGSLLQGRIDSVKINPSLLMRECSVTAIFDPFPELTWKHILLGLSVLKTLQHNRANTARALVALLS